MITEFVRKRWKSIRNTFHIPGEDVIIIGMDDRCKSIRVYDLYVKIGSKFESKLESKTCEGNVAQPFLWYAQKKLETVFTGWYDEKDPNLLHVEFTIDKRQGCIFKTEDKPNGVAYLMDMQTGQGAQLVRKTADDPLFEPKEDVAIAGPDFANVTIPTQIRIKRDPVVDLLYTINPYMLGSAIDSFIATELLRGKVEIWKIAIISGMTLVFGLIIGAGMG